MKSSKDYVVDNLVEYFVIIWTSMQLFIGFIVTLVTGAEKTVVNFDGDIYDIYIAKRFNRYWSGVSLGDYIIFADKKFTDIDSVKHEFGHYLQSLILGPLYLIIGLLSVCGNLWDRIAHKNWNEARRIKWYYKLPWEHWADVLGNVDRGF